MRKKGMISAILPTYNRSKFLLRAVGEIFNQSYQNFELIVVDDCSTDETADILSSLKNIKYIRLPKNSGSVSIPRNIGICNAIGEFIAPIDDDVISLPNKFEILINSFSNDDVLVYGNRIEYKDRLLNSPTIYNWNPLETWGVDNSQFIYRANVYDNAPLIFPTKACDWHTAKNIAKLGNIKHVDEIVSIYIWHEKNRSSNKEKIKIHPNEFKDYYNNNYNYKLDIESELN